MKFTAAKSAFLGALSHASRVVEKRNTIPILSNVLLTTKGNVVELRTTDLDLELTLSFEANVETEGTTTVQAQLLHDIVRKLSDKTEIAFSMDDKGQNAVISAGRSRFALQCLPSTDFPDLTAGAFKNSFELPPEKMRWLLSRTQFAISTEETRYYLNGIFFHVVDDAGTQMLRAVSTDGHRLAKASTAAPEGSVGMPGIIMPRKTVGELDKLLLGAKTMIVNVSDSKIRFDIDNMILVSKLIDGTFPDYERVIPQLGNQVAIANSKELSVISDRVTTVSSERGRAVRMTFSDGRLQMNVSNPDSGSAEDEMEINYEGEELTIGFNSRYMQDVMGVVSSEKVRIYVSDAGSPAVFKAEGDDNALFVLMPMRV